MTAMLASVNSPEEARLVLDAGVDIIDLKQPAQGALGALDVVLVAEIVNQIDGKCPLSATIGDLPMFPGVVFDAVNKMAATGVNYVKIGFFPGGDMQGSIGKLTELCNKGVKIIAVLFADAGVDMAIITQLADAGFSGVMLDTMNKKNGSLTSLMNKTAIASFVTHSKQRQMICGLAGSLTFQDIALLKPLQADYLGFRGALCKRRQRTAQLDRNAVLSIKTALS